MKYVFAALLPALLSAHSLLAQAPASTPTDILAQPAASPRPTKADSVYTEVEQMPELPGGGGMAAIVAAIQRAGRYPALALRNQVEGRIFVSFVVESSGQLSNVKAVRGLGSGLDEETVRATKTLPLLRPGKQNGQVVRVQYVLPIAWRIQ